MSQQTKPPTVPDLHPAESFRRFFDMEWRIELRQVGRAMDRINSGKEPTATAEDVRLLGLRLRLANAMSPEGEPA